MAERALDRVGDHEGDHAADLPDLDAADASILARLALGESPSSIMADLDIPMSEIRRICSLAGAR
jgi:hypothetical protein